MKVKFNVKFGENAIEIPISEASKTGFADGLTELFKAKVTIYNDVPAAADAPRSFERFVIDRCQITGPVFDKPNETIRNVVNAQTIITKDTEHYKSPSEYALLTAEERKGFYTASPGDYVVLSEVSDEITNAKEFSQLQQKYKNSGFKIANISVNIHGMAVDNVTMTN